MDIVWLSVGVLFVAGILSASLVIVKEWKRAVIFRLGRYSRILEPGVHFVLPFIEQKVIALICTQTMDVEPQEIMTRDSAPVSVDAVVYYKIVDPKKATINVEDYQLASIKLAQTTLRDIVGKHDLDSLLSKKEKLGDEIQSILDKGTDGWGIKVERVEIKDVILPMELKRAMAKEAEASREKKARLIKASAESESAVLFAKAAELLHKHPESLVLRQLQTFQEIGAEQNSLILVVPSNMTDMAKTIGPAAAINMIDSKKKAKKVLKLKTEDDSEEDDFEEEE